MRFIARATAILTTLAVLAGLVMLVRAQIKDVTVGESLRTHILLRDGSRIAAGSPVVIAGVRVGDIERVSLEGGLARVDLRLRDDIRIPQASVATRRADKLFGDSYVEIIPGTDPAAPILQPGQRILHVLEGSSADTILRGIDGALPKADRAMELTQEAAIEARQWVGGPLADGLARSASWLDDGKLQGPIATLDRSMVTIDDLTVRAEQALRGAEPAVLGTLDRFASAIQRTRDGMASATEGISGVAESTRRGLAEMDPVVDDLGQVLHRLDDPEDRGTMARLINDRELADDLDEAAASGAALVRDAQRFHILMGLGVEYHVRSRGGRAYVSAEISARPDSFYYVELGRRPEASPPQLQLRDDGGPGYVRSVELSTDIKFTAQFGKRLGPLSLRAGLRDSQFGVGADLTLGGRLRLSGDLFGASFSGAPNLRLAGALAVFRSLYVLAGVDQALTAPGELPVAAGGPPVPRVFERVHYGRDYFFGASLALSEDDLALLLRVYGAMLVGLL
ncbi:MAG: MCE family protein [Myxococcales bacterium]|nr:MCE family protein [Myxococcales bacterium]